MKIMNLCLEDVLLVLAPQFDMSLVQFSHFIMLCLGPQQVKIQVKIAMDIVLIVKHVIKGQFYKGIIGKKPIYGHFEPCYKGTILQRNYRKITILWSFSYNSFVKFQGKGIWEPLHGHIVSKSML